MWVALPHRLNAEQNEKGMEQVKALVSTSLHPDLLEWLLLATSCSHTTAGSWATVRPS